jgi:hypothetical protein
LIAATDNYSTNGHIYISGDGGTNWTLTQAPAQPWSTVSSSADGTKIFALNGELFGRLYSSTNSGSTWALDARAPYGASIAVSGDGEKLAIATGSDSIGFSTNHGGLWTNRTTGLYDMFRVVSSADGAMFSAANNAGKFTLSTNGGFTWSPAMIQGGEAISLDASADLRNLVAVLSWFSRLWVTTSTNMGQTWRSNALPTATWSAATTSADGTRFVAVAMSGLIYSSTNAGATWISNNAPALHWKAVSSSADGHTVFAAATNGGIWALRTTPEPELKIASFEDSLNLSWVVPSASFVLQHASALAADGWTSVTNAPVLIISNLSNEIILPVNAAAGFYRLKMQ